MSSKTISVILWCWHDPQTDATSLRVVHVDTSKEVRLSDASFLLRLTADENAPVLRCSIRHIASGREAHIQGGAKLRAFVKACLLGD